MRAVGNWTQIAVRDGYEVCNVNLMMICAFFRWRSAFSFPSTPQLRNVNARRNGFFLFLPSAFSESQFRAWLVYDLLETADNEPKTYILFPYYIVIWYTTRGRKWLFKSTNTSHHHYGDGIWTVLKSLSAVRGFVYLFRMKKSMYWFHNDERFLPKTRNFVNYFSVRKS